MTPKSPASGSTTGGPKRPRPPRSVIHRESSDASVFHMSSGAVDRGSDEIARWTDLECIRHLAHIRWNSHTHVTCPHCNSSAEHYWHKKERRWRCNVCRKKFSVTSMTVFANRRLPLQKLLAAIHLWASGSAGQPALELRRQLNIKGYNTAFTLVSKLREGLVRGFNTGLISGVVEMDAAHASGRRASEKRGRPLGESKTPDDQAKAEALMTAEDRKKARMAIRQQQLAAGGRVDPTYGAVFPASRRLTFTLRRRSGFKGKGALVTRVGVGMAETPEVAEALIARYVAVPESILATDTGTAFMRVGKQFQLHLQVNHSETLSGPDGQNNNQSESFSARQDRSEKGVYLNIEPKYLQDYVTETAFREDHRRTAPGATADAATFWALNVGLSQYWRGYTHGKHRDYEILTPHNIPAKPSGPEKGRLPTASGNGRAPR